MVFTDLALWTRSVIESPCLPVVLSVCAITKNLLLKVVYYKKYRPLVKGCILASIQTYFFLSPNRPSGLIWSTIRKVFLSVFCLLFFSLCHCKTPTSGGGQNFWSKVLVHILVSNDKILDFWIF